MKKAVVDIDPPNFLIKGKKRMYWNNTLKEYHGHASTGKYKCKCRGYSYEELIKDGYLIHSLKT